jgi:ubiquinone/menaquinone biosynthesis C-methylase UbiE
MNHLSKREFFDKEADGWDDRCHRDDEEEIRQLVERFELKPAEWILDLGTGGGVLLPHLRRKVGQEGRVVGLDFSWKMIREAGKARGKETFCLINGCVQKLPFKDRTFDCISCMDAFAHMNDKRVALNEMGRVLKEGGRVHLLHTLESKKLAEYHREVGGVVRDDVLPAESEMKQMMEKAGLKEIRIVDQPGLYLASARK